MKHGIYLLVGLMAALAWAAGLQNARAADWTQLGFNPARTACTDDEPKGPYKQAWTFDVWPNDHILMTVQVVTAQGKGFVGSKSGVLYAFNLSDGKLAWKYDAGRAIEQTAATVDGKVIFGAMDGCVHAVSVEDGKPVWKTDLKARGISNAPLVYEGKVYLGTRGGTFACLDPKDGQVVWQQPLGSPILQSPAAGDGRIYFSPEDMCLRALDARTGKVVWTAPRRPWAPPTLRGSHPVVCEGMILTDGYGAIDFSSWYVQKRPFNYDTQPKDLEIAKGQTLLEGDAIPSSYRQWIDRYAELLKKSPEYSTLYVHDAATGQPLQPFPSVGTQSMATPLQAPAVSKDGLVVYPMFFKEWHAFLGFFDPKTRQLKRILFGIDPVSGDETQNFSFGGNVFYTFHTWEHGACGSAEAFDFGAKKFIPIPLAKPGIGGNWKAAPPSNAVSISGNQFFHVAADRVVAWRGAQ